MVGSPSLFNLLDLFNLPNLLFNTFVSAIALMSSLNEMR
jgi:hypothetical protein